ncbi:MAG: HEAT repeat domain-containing protein [Planctomycetes bacterium]|nr:HEAT repeat domain-containing protein [Planctomycetota bacterium]
MILLTLAGGIGGYCWYWQSHAVDRKVYELVYEVANYPDSRTEKFLKEWKLDFLLHQKPGKRKDDVIVNEMMTIGPAATPELVCLLNDDNEDIRWWAAYMLGSVGDARAIKPLINILRKDAVMDVRCRAAYSLGDLGDKRSVEPLFQILQNETYYYAVRFDVALALGRLGDKRVVEELCESMHSEVEWDNDFVAKTLGQLGDARAIEYLKQARQNELISEKIFDEAMRNILSAATMPSEQSAQTAGE